MKKRFKRMKEYLLSANGREEVYVRLLLLIFALSCLVIHGGLFLFLSLFMGVRVIAWLNTVSIIVYSGMLYLTHRRRYNEAALVASVEITLYSLLNQILMGGNNQSFVFMFLLSTILLHLFVDYASFRLRLMVTFLSATLMGIIAWYGQFSGAPAYIDLSEAQIRVYSVTYLVVGIVSIVFGLLLQRFTLGYVNKLNKEEVRKLSLTAYTDNLMGLHNRQYAQVVFEDLKSKEKVPSIVVAMVDVDDFKRVNDAFGHEVGDFVLETIAKIAKKCFRSTDFVFRWGGEEVLILLVGANLENAAEILNLMREKINNDESIRVKLGYNVSITIGAGDFDVNNARESIRLADARLYYGKANGKNQVITKGMNFSNHS